MSEILRVSNVPRRKGGRQKARGLFSPSAYITKFYPEQNFSRPSRSFRPLFADGRPRRRPTEKSPEENPPDRVDGINIGSARD